MQVQADPRFHDRLSRIARNPGATAQPVAGVVEERAGSILSRPLASAGQLSRRGWGLFRMIWATLLCALLGLACYGATLVLAGRFLSAGQAGLSVEYWMIAVMAAAILVTALGERMLRLNAPVFLLQCAIWVMAGEMIVAQGIGMYPDLAQDLLGASVQQIAALTPDPQAPPVVVRLLFTL